MLELHVVPSPSFTEILTLLITLDEGTRDTFIRDSAYSPSTRHQCLGLSSSTVFSCCNRFQIDLFFLRVCYSILRSASESGGSSG